MITAFVLLLLFAGPVHAQPPGLPGPAGGYVKRQPGNARVIIFVNGIFGDATSTWELSRSLLNLAERDGRASYPQFTARRRVPT